MKASCCVHGPSRAEHQYPQLHRCAWLKCRLTLQLAQVRNLPLYSNVNTARSAGQSHEHEARSILPQFDRDGGIVLRYSAPSAVLRPTLHYGIGPIFRIVTCLQHSNFHPGSSLYMSPKLRSPYRRESRNWQRWHDSGCAASRQAYSHGQRRSCPFPIASWGQPIPQTF